MEIARSFCSVSECSKFHFLAFLDCTAIAQWLEMQYLGLSLPFKVAWSLDGHCAASLPIGSKSRIWAYWRLRCPCAVIAWCLGMLKMPFLGLWNLRGHCAVIALCLRMLKMPFHGLWRLCSHCAVNQYATFGPLEIAQ